MKKTVTEFQKYKRIMKKLEHKQKAEKESGKRWSCQSWFND